MHRERLYFDVQTGLLVRRVASSPQTVLGNLCYQVDYKDYKLFNGVKIPTTIDYAVPGVRWTRKIVQVKNNVPVDAGDVQCTCKVTRRFHNVTNDQSRIDPVS